MPSSRARDSSACSAIDGFRCACADALCTIKNAYVSAWLACAVHRYGNTWQWVEFRSGCRPNLLEFLPAFRLTTKTGADRKPRMGDPFDPVQAVLRMNMVRAGGRAMPPACRLGSVDFSTRLSVLCLRHIVAVSGRQDHRQINCGRGPRRTLAFANSFALRTPKQGSRCIAAGAHVRKA